MKNVLVIEDEPLAATRLTRLLNKRHPGYNVVDTLDTVRESVSFLSKEAKKLDLIFCDIHLADGKSFEVFEQIDVKTPVVFTTAYDEYTLKAFDINSVHYLLKPIDEQELAKAIRKFENIQDPGADIKNILSRFGQERTKRFLLRCGQRLIPKKESELAFFFSNNKVVHAADLNEGRLYMTDFTLEQLENEILSKQQFFRINRKHLVNKEAIRELKPFKNQRLLLSLSIPSKEELVLSRDKVKAFKEWFVEQ